MNENKTSLIFLTYKKKYIYIAIKIKANKSLRINDIPNGGFEIFKHYKMLTVFITLKFTSI